MATEEMEITSLYQLRDGGTVVIFRGPSCDCWAVKLDRFTPVQVWDAYNRYVANQDDLERVLADRRHARAVSKLIGSVPAEENTPSTNS